MFYDAINDCCVPIKRYLTAVRPGHVSQNLERRFFFSATEKIGRSVKMITARMDSRATCFWITDCSWKITE